MVGSIQPVDEDGGSAKKVKKDKKRKVADDDDQDEPKAKTKKTKAVESAADAGKAQEETEAEDGLLSDAAFRAKHEIKVTSTGPVPKPAQRFDDVKLPECLMKVNPPLSSPPSAASVTGQ